MISKDNKLVAYLLCESAITADAKVMSYNKENETVRIDAQLQDTEEWNRNTRKYPKPILQPALQAENIVELITRGKGVPGEAGHPAEQTVQRQLRYEHSNLSHIIKNFRWDKSIVRGTVDSLPTERGREFRDMIKCGIVPAFSLRALGPIEKTPQGDIVKAPLRVVTYDWVFLPSHRNSYTTKIESYNNNPTPNNAMMNESYAIPILTESALSYIKEESENYKLITEMMEFASDEIVLSENLNSIIVRDKSKGNDKLKIQLESYISKDIDNYFNSKKF